MNGRFREGAGRFAERRQRERDAPRLKAEVPRLASLRLEVEERRGSTSLPESKHVRLVVVDHAPALFVLLCADSACRDGEHDLTSRVMRYLQSGATEFVVEDDCNGTIGSANCGRVVRVLGKATYASS